MSPSAIDLIPYIAPPLQDSIDLQKIFTGCIHDFHERTGIHCETKFQLKDRNLNGSEIEAIFKSFQEILNNIARHANATNVLISMGEHAGMLMLLVKDNGIGITNDQVNSSNSSGIIRIKEYTRLYAGELRIKGIPEKGTTVIVNIPVKH